MNTPRPHVIVLFGAAGDLSRRKLLPGLLHLSSLGLLPQLRGSGSGTALEPLDDDGPRPRPAVLRAVRSRGRPTPEALEAFVAPALLRRPPRGGRRGPGRRRRGAPRPGSGGDADVLHYLSVPPFAAAEVVETIELAGLAAGAKVVLEKPFGIDLESARSLNAIIHRVFRRGSDLPHRPLPRQGGRAQTSSRCARQRPLRADLEPQPHRPRADRGAPPGSGSSSARRSMSTRARSATWWSPTCSKSSRSSPWSRRPSWTPYAISLEKDKVFRSPAARSTRARSFAASTRAIARSRGFDPESQTETMVALRCEVDNWPWSSGPLLPADGQAARRGRAGSSRSPSASRRRAVPGPPRGSGRYGPDHLTFDLDEASRGSALLRRQAARAPGWRSRSSACSSRSRRQPREAAGVLEAYERLILDAIARRARRSSRPRRGSSACGRSLTPLLDDPPPVLTLPAGLLGPGRGSRR